MALDVWALYSHMIRSRLFEEAVTVLWDQGLISGEMHLGTGEEGIIAGIVSQLSLDDALALDHTCCKRGLPLISSSILPGKRSEAKRAGITML